MAQARGLPPPRQIRTLPVTFDDNTASKLDYHSGLDRSTFRDTICFVVMM